MCVSASMGYPLDLFLTASFELKTKTQVAKNVDCTDKIIAFDNVCVQII